MSLCNDYDDDDNINMIRKIIIKLQKLKPLCLLKL